MAVHSHQIARGSEVSPRTRVTLSSKREIYNLSKVGETSLEVILDFSIVAQAKQ